MLAIARTPSIVREWAKDACVQIHAQRSEQSQPGSRQQQQQALAGPSSRTSAFLVPGQVQANRLSVSAVLKPRSHAPKGFGVKHAGVGVTRWRSATVPVAVLSSPIPGASGSAGRRLIARHQGTCREEEVAEGGHQHKP
ncbi:unnamed protein product [Cutaneotrichosporon oleaginosum]